MSTTISDKSVFVFSLGIVGIVSRLPLNLVKEKRWNGLLDFVGFYGRFGCENLQGNQN